MEEELSTEEQLQQQNDQQRVLLGIGQAVLKMVRPHDLDSVLQLCLDEIGHLRIDAQAISIHRVIDRGQNLTDSFWMATGGTVLELERRKLEKICAHWKNDQIVCMETADWTEVARESLSRKYKKGLLQSVMHVPFSLGVVTVLSVHSQAFSESNGGILREIAEIFLLGIVRMEELLQAEKEIAARMSSESKYRTLIQNAPVCIHEIDMDGCLTSMNQAGLAMMGETDESDICGMRYLNVVAPPDRERIGALLEQAFEGHASSFEFAVEANGRTLFFDSCFIPLTDPDGRVVKLMGVTQDITERKQTEQERVRIQRLLVANELSAGVSHNLNNILTGVIGPVQLLQMKTDDPDLLVDLGDIFVAAIRARDLVSRLHRSTQRVEIGKVQAVCVGKMVDEAIKETRPRWKDESESKGLTIEFEKHLSGDHWIRATESEFNDILINLILNAVDAMPEGGRITIKTKRMND
ncbi:MAG: PAS domain S-box protein, partial [Candidatus Latescibacteria bacterium]|nr:PAS domain S-box protein [Candidatus Latescibacterota bacterium]